MGRTTKQILKIVGVSNTVRKKNTEPRKTASEIIADAKGGKYDFSLVKKDLENTIRFDTFASDISSMGKTIGDSTTNWQTQETMSNNRQSIESMNSRLSAYKEYVRLFGDDNSKSNIKSIDDIQEYSRKSLDAWDDISAKYGKYKNADAYTNEKNKLTELYSMNSEQLKGKKGVAYTTADGYNIKWEDLYNDAYLKEYEADIDKTVDVTKYGNYKKKDVKYESSWLNPEYPVASDEKAHKYNLVNGDKDAVSHEELYNVHLSNTNDDLKYLHVSEDERRRFNALWETQGADKAIEYIESLDSELRQRRIADEREFYSQMAKESPISSSVVSVISNLGNNAMALPFMAAEYLDDGEIDPDDPLYTNRRTVQTIRSTVENNIDNDVGKFFYRHGMNIADNLATRAVSLGMGTGAASQFLMSSGAAVDTVIDAKERGLSDGQALSLGAISGAAEWYFESKGFEAWVDKKTLTKNAWEYFANSLKTELVGEVFTEGANDIADILIAQDVNKLNTEYKSYLASGLSEKEAFVKVVGGVASRYADVVAGTILSTGAMSGPSATIGGIQQHSYNKSIGQNIRANERVGDMLDFASNPEMASAYEAYSRYAKKGVNAENVSDAKLGRLHTNAMLDAQAVIDSKTSTPEQIKKAQETIEQLEVYSQANVGTRTGSAKNIDSKVIKGYTEEDISNLIESGLESAEGTEAHTLAMEYDAKIKSGKELTTTEIANLMDANDKAIRSEESNEIATKLVEKGESQEIADIVARKMRGEILTTEESEKIVSSEVAPLVIGEVSNVENATAEVMENAKTMDKDKGALFISLYDGKTDVKEYSNAFNLAVMKTENNFGIKDILATKSVLSTDQVGRIFTELAINKDKAQRVEYQKLAQRTANLKVYKGKIDDTIIDYNNTSAEGKVNWNDERITPRMRKAITFLKGFAQATGLNLKLVTNGKEENFNGVFDVTNNEIIIDIFAGVDVDLGKVLDTIIPTMSHELTHWMEKKSPVLYRKISNLVFETLEKHDGVSESDRIADEIRKLTNDGTLKETDSDSKKIEVARSEIVARACEDVLAQSKVGKEMFNSLSQKEQKTLVEKIKDIIQNIMDWVSDALGLYKNASYQKEADILRKYQEECDRLLKLWDEMLKESVEVNQALEKSGAFKHESTEGEVVFCKRSNSPSEFNPDGLTLRNQLEQAFDESVSNERRYVYIGKFTQNFVDKLKGHIVVKNLPIVMNYRDAYLSMKSKENGKYKGEGVNYHNLGVEGLESALKSFDNPEYVLLSKKEGKIELILEGRDYKNRQLFSVVEVNTEAQHNRKFLPAHVVTSVYGNRSLKNRIEKAEMEGRVIYNKKEESTQGMPQVQYKRDINVNSPNNSIHNSNEIVKEKFSDEDMRFSMRRNVEETKDLIAVHNASESQLIEALNRGHFIMPSLAVTNKSHTAFGDISIVFEKDTINPETNKANKLYGADAWTPTQTTLKINPKFNNTSTETVVKDIKRNIGKNWSQIFDINSAQFRETIASAKGSIYNAYADNIGMQTAFAKETGLIETVPMKNGRIDVVALKENLEEKLNKDSVWRSYKKWLGNMSDTIIESYDKASTEEIFNSMKAQPDSAKTFNLSENGELTVPVIEYHSIDEMRQNKGRLSENADNDAKVVAKEFLSWARNISDTSNVSMKDMVKAINASFSNRYDVQGIVNSFRANNVAITKDDARSLQSLYRKAVELPTLYFEAKPQRLVGFGEVASVVLPSNVSTELKTKLDEQGIPYTEYENGDNTSRVDALNSIDDVRFSKRDGEDSTTSERNYSYDELISKDDLKGIVVGKSQQVKLTPDGSIDAGWIVSEVKKKCESLKTKSDVTVYYTNVSDIGRNVEITKTGIVHSFFKSVGHTKKPSQRDLINARVSLELPRILSNSIEVNRSVRSGNNNVPYSHIMMGTVGLEDNSGNVEYYAVRAVIEERVNQNPVLAEAEILGKLYAINAKKVGTPNAQVTKNGVAFTYDVAYTYNIAQFLEDVKTDFDDTFSEDVYRNLGMTRKENEFSQNLLYSKRETTSVYDKMGETERIKKENEKLKADVERLNERLKLEKQVTHGNVLNDNHILSAAGHLRNIANSGIDKVQLARSLKGLYSFILQSENLTWEEVYERSYRIAESILAEAKPQIVVDDYSKMILKDIKNTPLSFSEQQKREAQYRFGKNWNRYFFGRTSLRNDGISLDSKWQEWASLYPDIFDADITENDMVSELYDIIDNLQETSESIAEYDTIEETRWLANEVYNQYWNVSSIKTTADKYDKQIKKLTFEHRKTMNELRSDYEERIGKQKLADDIHFGRKMSEQKEKFNSKLAEQRQAQKERHIKTMNELRSRKDEQIAEAKQHGREMMSKYRENAERKTLIQRVTAKSKVLRDKIEKNNKDKHIPEVFKGPVLKLLTAIDFSSKSMLDKGVPTSADYSFVKVLADIKNMYEEANKNMVSGLEDLYGRDLTEQIELLRDSMYRLVGDNNYVINAMSVDELRGLNSLIDDINIQINKFDKFHVANHAKGVIDLAQNSSAEMNALGAIKYKGKALSTFGELNWNITSPYYAFRRYGDSSMKILKALMDGDDKIQFLAEKVTEFTKNLYSDKDIRKWEKDAYDFEIKQINGEIASFRMSLPQIMELYCSIKQEDAKEHFANGITIEKNDESKTAAVIDNILLDYDGYNEILSVLDLEKNKKAKEVAEALHKYMGEEGKKLIDEIYMARWGIKMNGVKDYYPLRVSEGTIDDMGDSKEETMAIQKRIFSLINAGFSKNRKPGASQSILIGNIFDTFATHMAEVITYNAMTLPILDAMKWYNYRGSDSFGKEFGVKKSMLKAFGKDGANYFTQLIEDINGVRNTARDGIYSTLLRNYKIAAVGAKIKTALLQPTAYPKALSLIDAKYLAKGFSLSELITAKNSKRAIEHCGIALRKARGYGIDVNIGRGLANDIKHKKSKTEKLREWSMKLAEKGDAWTFGCLWNACELEIRDTRKDLKVGSKEFYDVVGEKMREVVYATQVADSTLTRCPMMRSNDGKAKELTMFMSEPILGYNIVTDAFISYSLDKKRMGKDAAKAKHKSRIARVLTGYTLTQAFAAVVETTFASLYYDDDDEEFNWFKEFLKNWVLNMGLIGKIPYFKEFVSMWQGYSTTRVETQAIKSFFDAFDAWKKIFVEGKASQGPKAIKNTIRSLSDLFGTPFYNVYKQMVDFKILDEEDIKEMFEDFID